MEDRNQIHDAADMRAFVYAGNATFTLVSGATGARFTYRVRRAEGDNGGRPWFVGLLSGPDNESAYSYLGTIFANDTQVVRHTAKSRVGPEAPSAKALAWFLRQIHNPTKLGQVEFWHEGRCGACGRKLTVPESIATGLGPVCAGRMG